jgi:hypothetical protein
VFPVRYELNSYILFRRNSVFKGLIKVKTAMVIKQSFVSYHSEIEMRWINVYVYGHYYRFLLNTFDLLN